MRVKIISDSTCDLSPALLERYDIAVTPLCVIKDGKDFHDGVDITPADIFAHVDGGGDLCSTSAVSQYEYGEMFARYANEYDAVVQITIGANFSCCYQNACAAAQEYENVFVVDSENLSTGQGLLVVAAAKLAEQGLSGAEIAERVRALAPKVEKPEDWIVVEGQHRARARARAEGRGELFDRVPRLHAKGRPLLGCGRAGRESSAPEALHRGAKRQDGRVQEVPRLV